MTPRFRRRWPDNDPGEAMHEVGLVAEVRLCDSFESMVWLCEVCVRIERAVQRTQLQRYQLTSINQLRMTSFHRICNSAAASSTLVHTNIKANQNTTDRLRVASGPNRRVA